MLWQQQQRKRVRTTRGLLWWIAFVEAALAVLAQQPSIPTPLALTESTLIAAPSPQPPLASFSPSRTPLHTFESRLLSSSSTVTPETSEEIAVAPAVKGSSDSGNAGLWVLAVVLPIVVILLVAAVVVRTGRRRRRNSVPGALLHQGCGAATRNKTISSEKISTNAAYNAPTMFGEDVGYGLIGGHSNQDNPAVLSRTGAKRTSLIDACYEIEDDNAADIIGHRASHTYDLGDGLSDEDVLESASEDDLPLSVHPDVPPGRSPTLRRRGSESSDNEYIDTVSSVVDPVTSVVPVRFAHAASYPGYSLAHPSTKQTVTLPGTSYKTVRRRFVVPAHNRATCNCVNEGGYLSVTDEAAEVDGSSKTQDGSVTINHVDLLTNPTTEEAVNDSQDSTIVCDEVSTNIETQYRTINSVAKSESAPEIRIPESRGYLPLGTPKTHSSGSYSRLYRRSEELVVVDIEEDHSGGIDEQGGYEYIDSGTSDDRDETPAPRIPARGPHVASHKGAPNVASSASLVKIPKPNLCDLPDHVVQEAYVESNYRFIEQENNILAVGCDSGSDSDDEYITIPRAPINAKMISAVDIADSCGQASTSTRDHGEQFEK